MKISKKVLLSVLILLLQPNFFAFGMKKSDKIGALDGAKSSIQGEELELTNALEIDQHKIPDIRSSSPGQEMKIVDLEELEGEGVDEDFREGLKQAIEDRIFSNINLGERNCLLKITTLGFLSSLYNNIDVSEYRESKLSADIIVTILKRAKEFDTDFLRRMISNSKIKQSLIFAGIKKIPLTRREILIIK